MLCLAVGVLALAGCSSSPARTANPPTASPSVTAATGAPAPTVPPDTATPTATATTAASGPSATPAGSGSTGSGCATSALTVRLRQDGGGAGSAFATVLFTNRTARSCVLDGFPGLSYVTGADAHQVGAAAVRATSSVPAPVRLAPGQSGSASIRLGNAHTYPEGDCRPVAVDGLRVYPPRSTASVVVRLPGGTDACSASRLAGGPELEVGPVEGR